MAAFNHIIKRQVLELNIDDESRVKELQDKARELYYQEIVPELDKLFSKYAANGTTFSIPSLEIDLGELQVVDFEKQFTKQVMAQVQSKLDQLMAKARAGGSEEISVKTREVDIWEAFIHFLKNGYLPWWSVDRGLDQEVLRELISNVDDARLYQLRKVLDNRHVLQRASWQLEEAVIQNIIASLDSNRYAENYFGVLTELFHSMQLSISGQDLNKILLGALVKYPPDKEEEEFVKVLIKHLRGNINFGDTNIAIKLQKTEQRDKQAHKVVKAWLEQLTVEPGHREEAGESIDELKQVEEDGHEVYINNAGLVLLWPYLQQFFEQAGIVKEGTFVDQEATFKAIHILQFAVTGEAETHEHLLPLNKLLCGIDIQKPIPKNIELFEAEKGEVDELLNSVIENWPALKNTSIEGFRNSFLIREGKLTRKEDGWQLLVEQQGYDVLLDKLPWSIQWVKLPWMPKPIHVQW